MSDDRPNVILIFTDQLRADALGCYGNDIIQTPHIDGLANQGVLFEDCSITQPTCTPSRASILSGCYPSALKTRMVGCTTPDDPRFLGHVLAKEGYHTASIGKIHLIPQGREPDAVSNALGDDGPGSYFGFREIELVNGHGARCFGPGYSARLAETHPNWKQLYDNKQFINPGLSGEKAGTYVWPYDEEISSSHYIADQTISFLERQHDKPFFLHLSFNDPHHPFTVPEPWASMYDPKQMPIPVTHDNGAAMPPWYLKVYEGSGSDRVPDGTYNDPIAGTVPMDYRAVSTEDWQQVKALYYGMISYLDHQLGRILDSLEGTGLAEHTILALTSDHGDYLGDHGYVGKGYPFDSVLRVPLIYSGTEVLARHREAGVTSTIDIAPTLFEMAGIEEPTGVQGISHAETVCNGASMGRTAALTENDDDFAGEKIRTLTTSDWRLSYYTGRNYGELYNRRQDPDQRDNLWDSEEHQDIKSQLIQDILEEVMCSLDILPVRDQKPAPIPKKWISRRNR